MAKLLLSIIFFLTPGIIFANESATSPNIVHQMMVLIFQIGIIIFASRTGGILFEKIKLPSVLGELSSGILIGPYMLGAIPLPGFENGLFAMHGNFPISTELYGIATLASILLLFSAGLETDIKLFLKYSFAGTMVGIGGIIVSFFIGAATAVLFLDIEFMNPTALFLGVMGTATSVGITARILSERRSMDSPEGVTILAGAVIDDVLGIILLAIVIGISSINKNSDSVQWGKIGIIALKAVGVWLGFTITGLLMAHKISAFLKLFKSKTVFTVVSIGIAMIVAGIFEQAGLAMIIGAYVTGLALSKTDISNIIQEKTHPIETFLVPIFFTVMGMMVNLSSILSKETLIFGIIYSFGAIFSKIIGCAIPAYFLGFNKLGMGRIGLGMVPRGEVALIVAGIGISNSIINENIFGVAIMMTLSSTIIAPPLLNILLKKRGKGTYKEKGTFDKESTIFNFASEELTELIENTIIKHFKKEGFFINMMELDSTVYNIKKGNIYIKMFKEPLKIIFKTDKHDTFFVKNIMYESVVLLNETVTKIKETIFTEEIRKSIIESRKETSLSNIGRLITKYSFVKDMKASSKKEAIEELVSHLSLTYNIKNSSDLLNEILKRENQISTGMENGLAIPHCRTKEISSTMISIGISKKGIDFNSFDNMPATLIILIVSPDDNSAHIEILSEIGSIFSSKEAITKFIKLKTREEMADFFTKSKR